MNIRGLVKFSLIDFPGGISCVIFVGYCNFRCPFCHNPHLVLDPESQPEISQATVIDFLRERKGKIDAIVISGGEPTLRPRLSEFLEQIKEFGFHIKLDTNGSNPEVVRRLFEAQLIDSLGVDLKAHRDKYAVLAGRNNPVMIENVYRTLRYAVQQKIPIDVRTTVHKELLDAKDLGMMRAELDEIGIDEWTIQQFNPVAIIDETLKTKETFSDCQLAEIARTLGGKTKIHGIKDSAV